MQNDENARRFLPKTRPAPVRRNAAAAVRTVRLPASRGGGAARKESVRESPERRDGRGPTGAGASIQLAAAIRGSPAFSECRRESRPRASPSLGRRRVRGGGRVGARLAGLFGSRADGREAAPLESRRERGGAAREPPGEATAGRERQTFSRPRRVRRRRTRRRVPPRRGPARGPRGRRPAKARVLPRARERRLLSRPRRRTRRPRASQPRARGPRSLRGPAFCRAARVPSSEFTIASGSVSANSSGSWKFETRRMLAMRRLLTAACAAACEEARSRSRRDERRWKAGRRVRRARRT